MYQEGFYFYSYGIYEYVTFKKDSLSIDITLFEFYYY